MIKYIYVLAASGRELETQRHKLRGLFHPNIKFVLLKDDYQLRGNQNIVIVELDGWENCLSCHLPEDKKWHIKDYLNYHRKYISLWLTEKDLR